MEKIIEEINKLSEEYYAASQELAGIGERKGPYMLELLKEHGSKPKADIHWRATADGKREEYLKAYLKGLGSLKQARVLTFKADRGIL